MENQENNNLIELQQLKVQYETLKQQFDQQEIVNNNIIHEMLHAGISNFKRRNAEIILIYGMLAATACWIWYYLDLRFPFMVISVLLFTLTGLFEWFSCQKILHINIEDVDVQTLVKKIDRGSTRFSLLWITVVFALCLWMMWFISEIGEKVVDSAIGHQISVSTNLAGLEGQYPYDIVLLSQWCLLDRYCHARTKPYRTCF